MKVAPVPDDGVDLPLKKEKPPIDIPGNAREK